MQPLRPALQPLAVEHGVDLARENSLQRRCPLPRPRETGWRRRAGNRSRDGAPPPRRWPRRERTARSSFAPPITLRRRPRNSQTQVSHAWLAQRRVSVLVAGSWMMPRLPVNRPRCGVAMMSPDGVTRFCSGILTARIGQDRHCEERQRRSNPFRGAMDCFASLAMTAGSATPRRRGSAAGTTARYPRERRSRCPATPR